MDYTNGKKEEEELQLPSTLQLSTPLGSVQTRAKPLALPGSYPLRTARTKPRLPLRGHWPQRPLGTRPLPTIRRRHLPHPLARRFRRPIPIPIPTPVPLPIAHKFPHAGANWASSVVAIKFDRGVIMAADTLVSAGSLARYQQVHRVFKINDHLLFGGCGDFPDVQYINRTLGQKSLMDYCCNDGITFNAKTAYTMMQRLIYARQLNGNPLLVHLVIGGLSGVGLPYLCSVNNHGCVVDQSFAGTGMGQQVTRTVVERTQPFGRKFTLPEAANAIRSIMTILYYRNTKSIAQYTVGICTGRKCSVMGPFKAEERWEMAQDLRGF